MKYVVDFIRSRLIDPFMDTLTIMAFSYDGAVLYLTTQFDRLNSLDTVHSIEVPQLLVFSRLTANLD